MMHGVAVHFFCRLFVWIVHCIAAVVAQKAHAQHEFEMAKRMHEASLIETQRLCPAQSKTRRVFKMGSKRNRTLPFLISFFCT
jgi:hypothetical protein